MMSMVAWVVCVRRGTGRHSVPRLKTPGSGNLKVPSCIPHNAAGRQPEGLGQGFFRQMLTLFRCRLAGDCVRRGRPVRNVKGPAAPPNGQSFYCCEQVRMRSVVNGDAVSEAQRPIAPLFGLIVGEILFVLNRKTVLCPPQGLPSSAPLHHDLIQPGICSHLGAADKGAVALCALQCAIQRQERLARKIRAQATMLQAPINRAAPEDGALPAARQAQLIGASFAPALEFRTIPAVFAAHGGEPSVISHGPTLAPQIIRRAPTLHNHAGEAMA